MNLGPPSRFPWLKLAAACGALGLHAAVLAVILSAPVTQVALGQPDALDVQFVELGPALEPAVATAGAAGAPPAPEPEVEPLAEPDPAVMPEAEASVEPPPEPVADRPQARPRPESHVRPKPERRHRPQPEARPPTVPAEQPAPAGGQAARDSSPGGASRSVQARGEVRAQDPDRPRTIGRVDYLGERPSPAYPRVSQRRGEQGRVVLRVLISPDGRVAQVKVQHSSGYERLDEAAVQAMQRARFRPYTENGIAYKALVDIPFDFIL